jgi:hypothetical protein
MGPIKDNKMAEFDSLVDNDSAYKFIVVEEDHPPVYIVEGLPGNAYSLDDTKIFQGYSLRHEVVKFGFCQLTLINKTHLNIQRIVSETGETMDEFYLIKGIGGSSFIKKGHMKLLFIILGVIMLAAIVIIVIVKKRRSGEDRKSLTHA